MLPLDDHLLRMLKVKIVYYLDPDIGDISDCLPIASGAFIDDSFPA